MDQFQEYRPGAVFIQDDRITAVGPAESMIAKYRPDADQVISAQGQILIPGLIDAHEHAGADRLAEPLLVSMDTQTWLRKYKWPLLDSITPEEIRLGAELAYLEAIHNGVTTTIMNYYAGRGMNQDGVPETADRLGVRTILARGYHDLPGGAPDMLLETGDELHKAYTELVDRWLGRGSGRISVAIAPVNLAYTDPSNLPDLGDLAQQHNIGFHTHLAENQKQVTEYQHRTGQSMVETLEAAGALGSNTQAAQAIYLSKQDIQILAKTNTSVVHCPSSNMRSTKGVCPIGDLQAGGVNIALGSDTVETLLSTMRLAVYLRRITTMDPQSFTARDALYAATVAGARAIGQPEQLGQITPGFKADLALVDPVTVDVVPYIDPYEVVAMRIRSNHVTTVMVDGQFLLQDRRVTQFDEERVLQRAVQVRDAFIIRFA